MTAEAATRLYSVVIASGTDAVARHTSSGQIATGGGNGVGGNIGHGQTRDDPSTTN